MASTRADRLGLRGRTAGGLLALFALVAAALRVPALLARGAEWGAVAAAGVLAATGVIGVALALPRVGARLLDRLGVPVDDGGAIGFAIVVAVATILFGLLALTQTVVGLQFVLEGGDVAELFRRPTFAVLIASLAVNLVLFVLAAVGYLRFAHGCSLGEAAEALGIDGRPRDALEGVGWGVAGLLAMGLLGAALTYVGLSPPRNVLADLITQTVTFPQAVALSLVAAVGEEVFFRGFLQPRIGLLPQAALFGLAHATYLNVFEVVGTFALALAFGYAYRRTSSLYAPVAGHAAVNVLVFALARYAPSP